MAKGEEATGLRAEGEARKQVRRIRALLMKGFGKGSSSLERSVLPHQDLTPRRGRGSSNGGVLEGNIKSFLMRGPAVCFSLTERKYRSGR